MSFFKNLRRTKKQLLTAIAGGICGIFLGIISFGHVVKPLYKFINPLGLYQQEEKKEVFGFAPYWTLDKLENVDFSVLTTLAYFDIPVMADGSLEQGYGYESFMSDRATKLFNKAHAHGTKVVLTITQMDNETIEALLQDEEGQKRTIDQVTALVRQRGIDGVNVDFEYFGNPGPEFRGKFSKFVKNLKQNLSANVGEAKSQVTVSVYASAVKEPKIYDISELAKSSDAIFMMAYDFATTASDSAMPTAPLHGHKEGKYWYDVSTAVEDFLTEMPAEKLILGVPWYGYNYLVYEPKVKSETYSTWYNSAEAQTYSVVKNEIKPNGPQVEEYLTGWDNEGKVGWRAYFDSIQQAWRMIFIEDVRSLSIKFDYANSKKLKGVGIWALGFDNGQKEFWDLIANKFGIKGS